jgi:hypothetical protein
MLANTRNALLLFLLDLLKPSQRYEKSSFIVVYAYFSE